MRKEAKSRYEIRNVFDNRLLGLLDVSEITGKKGVYLETTLDAWTQLWGPAGNELSLQFKYGELRDPWQETDEFISSAELGIDEKEVVGFRGTIEGLKHMMLLLAGNMSRYLDLCLK